MGFLGGFGEFIEELEEREERREYFEQREEYFEDRSLLAELFLPGDAWEMEGSYYDPYSHGEMFYDPAYGHHGVLYQGAWHPLEYQGGNWIFTHPHRYRLPQNLAAPQQIDYRSYNQSPQSRYAGQSVTGWMPGAASAPQSQAPNTQQTAAGSPAYCTACGALLSSSARPCAYCGRVQVL
jgi:hypothetical protein